MRLICPSCSAAQLRVVSSVELGPDSYWDENTVQRVKCGSCDQKFLANYLEKRSFRPDRDDKVSHAAFRVGNLYWLLVGFGFEKPRRKISKPWRRKLALAALAKASAASDAEPISYKTVQKP